MDTNKDGNKEKLKRQNMQDNKVVFHQRRQSTGVTINRDELFLPEELNEKLKNEKESKKDIKKRSIILDAPNDKSKIRSSIISIDITKPSNVNDKFSSFTKITPNKEKQRLITEKDEEESAMNESVEFIMGLEKSKSLANDKRKSLYDKMQDSLKSYINENKKEMVPQINKRHTVKPNEIYFKSNNMSRSNPKFEREETSQSLLNESNADSMHDSIINERGVFPFNQGHTKARDMIVDSFKDSMILKDLNIDPKTETKITTAVINKKKDSLTPIPSKKKNLENQVKKTQFTKAERSAVQIRRLEYAYGIKKDKSTTKINLNYENLRIAKSVRIQRWWRNINRRIRNITLIQACYRSHRVRKKFFDLLENANQIMNQLNQFKNFTSRPFTRRCFRLIKLIYRKAMSKINKKKGMKKISDVLLNKREAVFHYLINWMKNHNSSVVIQDFIRKYQDSKRFMAVLTKRLFDKLNKIILKRSFKTLILLMRHNMRIIRMKNYFININEKTNSAKIKTTLQKLKRVVNILNNRDNLKNNLLRSILNRLNKRGKEKLKKSVFKWMKNIIAMTKVYRNSKNIESLIRPIECIFRQRNLNLLLKCFNYKIKDSKRTTNLNSCCKKKLIYDKFSLSKYFNLWKSKQSNSIRDKLFRKICRQIFIRHSNQILRNLFKRWVSLKNERMLKRERSMIMRRFFDLAKGINLLTQCIKMTNDKRRMLNNLIINRSEKRKTQLLMKVVKNLINSDSLNKKFYLISLSKYTKSCSNREVKLKNFIRRITALIKQSLLANFLKWEILTQKMKKVIELKKIPLLKEFINKLQIAMINNVLSNGFMENYQLNLIYKKLKTLTLNKKSKNLNLLKKRFDRWLKNITIKKSNQRVANDLMKKMFAMRGFSNLLTKNFINNAEVLQRLKKFGLYNRKNKILCKIILDYFPLSQRSILKNSFVDWRLLNEDYINKFSRIYSILKEILKNKSKTNNMRIKPTYFIRWREISKASKSHQIKEKIKKFNEIISPILWNNLKTMNIFPSLELKAKDSRTNILLKSRVKKVDKKNNINKKNYFDKWKRNILKLQISKMSNRLKNDSLKRILYKSIKNCLNVYHKKWKNLAKKKFDICIKDGSKILNKVLNRHISNYIKFITSNLLENKKLKSMKKVNKISNKLNNSSLNKYFNLWNKHSYKGKVINFSSIAVRKIIRYLLLKKHLKDLKNYFVLWNKQNASTNHLFNQSNIKAVKLVLNHCRRKNLDKIMSGIRNTKSVKILRNLIKSKYTDDKMRLRIYFNQYKNKILNSDLNRNKILKNVIKSLAGKNRMGTLMKYFNKFKKNCLQNYLAMNLVNRIKSGIKLAEFTFYKKYFDDLFNETNNRLPLLKSGHHMNSRTAKSLNRKNLAKVLSIREIFFRKYLRIWRSKVANQKGARSIISLLEKFKNKISKFTFQEFKNNFNSKLEGEIYKNFALKSLIKTVFNNSKDALRRYLKLWKITNDKLKSLGRSINNLINSINSKSFLLLTRHAQINKDKNVSLLKTSRKLNRRNKKDNLHKYFIRWRLGMNKMTIQLIQIRIITRVLIKFDKKYNDKLSILKKYFNKYMRNVSFIKTVDIDDIYSNLERYKKGSEVLKHYLYKQELPIINQFVKNRNQYNSLKRCLFSSGKLLNRMALKYYFDKLLNNSLKYKLAEGKFKELSKSKGVSKRLNKNFSSELCNAFKILSKHMNNSAQKIQSSLKNRKNMNRCKKREEFVASLIGRYSRDINVIFVKNYMKWKRLSLLNNISYSANIIQNFIRNKIKNKSKQNKIRFINNLNLVLRGHCHKFFLSYLNELKDNYKKNKSLNDTLNKIGKLNDSKKLLNYFQRWSYLCSKIRKAASLKISNALRNKSALKKRKDLLKIKTIKKIFNHCNIVNENLFKLYLLKWINNTHLLKMISNTVIIQRFLSLKLKKLNNNKRLDKLKNIFKRKLQSKVAEMMFNLKNQKMMNKIYNAVVNRLSKLILQHPFHKIKSFFNLQKLDNLIKRKYSSDKDRLGYYFIQWRKINNIQKNIAASVLTRNLKKFGDLNKTSRLNRIDNKVFTLLYNLTNQVINKRKKYFYIWLYKTNLYKINQSASKVQNKFRQIKSKRKADILKFNNLINGLYTVDYIKKIAIFANSFNSFKLGVNKFLLETNIIKKYVTNNLFRVNKIIDRNKILSTMIRIANNKEQNYLIQKYLNIWKIRSQNLIRHVIRLQSAVRGLIARLNLYKRKIKQKQINHLIESCLIRADDSNKDKFIGYFKRFKYKTLMMQLNEKAEIIQNKFRSRAGNLKGKRLLALSKLNKIAEKTKFKKLIESLQLFNKCYAKFKSFIDGRKRKILNKLKVNVKLYSKLKTLHALNCKKNKESKLFFYLNTWKNLTTIIKIRESNAANKIITNMRSNYSKVLKSKAGRKKKILLKYLSLMSIKGNFKLAFYFDNWFNKNLSERVNYSAQIIQKFIKDKLSNRKLESSKRLFKVFKRLNQFAYNRNTKAFTDKLYKIYIYKILKNLYKTLLSNLLIKKGKDVFKSMRFMLIQQDTINSKYNYSNKKKTYKKIVPKEFYFKEHVQNNKRLVCVNNSERMGLIIGPQFRLFINSLILKKKNMFLRALENDYRIKKILDKFNLAASIIKRKNNTHPFHKILNKNIKSEHLLKLQKLFRLFALKRINKNSSSIKRLSGLSKLLKLIFINKEISKSRLTREILRRWRFTVIFKKMANAKLGLLYKNMHLMYLNVADEFFGDNPESMKSMIENMGDKFGYFDLMDNENYMVQKNVHVSKEKSDKNSAMNSSIEYFDNLSTGYYPVSSLPSTNTKTNRNHSSTYKNDKSNTANKNAVNVKIQNKNKNYEFIDSDDDSASNKSIKSNYTNKNLNNSRGENLNNITISSNFNVKDKFEPSFSYQSTDKSKYLLQKKDFEKREEPEPSNNLKLKIKPIVNQTLNKKK